MSHSILKCLALIAITGAVSCGSAVLDPVQGTTNEIDVLAHWTFNENLGADVHDVSQNRHDGTLVGGRWVVGRFGNAVFLAGGDHVTIPNFPFATLSWSVSLWLRFAPGDFGTGRSTVIGSEMNGGGWEVNAPNGFNPAGVQFTYPTMGGGGPMGGGSMSHTMASCCEPPPVDTWFHVTAVFNGDSKTLSIYQGTVLGGMTHLQGLIQPGSPTLTIGTNSNNTDPFQGSVDEIRIYSRALNQAEINALELMP